jgi:type 1 glutamine amidotransferase
MHKLCTSTFTVLLTLVMASTLQAKPIKVLIVDGPQRYHNYKESTPLIKDILEKSGKFKVDLSRSPDGGSKDGSYKPDFDKYDVIVVNEGFGANLWPKATEEAFEKYITKGGGMVSYHAADNSWPKWEAYNKMTGIGGWSGRGKHSGPYLYTDKEGKVIRDDSPGRGGSHGAQHEYDIVVRATKHPIMKGLPATFKHGPDELYDSLRGPAENVTILATSHSAKSKGGTGREEPVLMTITYGKGRIFHTVLGHSGKQIKEGSFVTTFLRGTEWAATGKVKIKVPKDFPNQKY